VTKRFGKLTALDEVSLEVNEGEFFCVVGPSNAGKSTLLKTIAGLHRPDSGRVAILGRDVTPLQPKDRRVSLLFQNIALFPNLTGFENIAFPLATARVAQEEIRHRVNRVAEMLNVTHILSRHPRTFSGGEQQRVAIGRAIIMQSDVLMLDEPLSNLDARIRIAVRLEFKRLRQEMAKGILYVTHDQIEAMSLSDRIAVLHLGRIQQIGTPDEVFHLPANRVVARLFGTPPMNIVPVQVRVGVDGPELFGDGFSIKVPGVSTLARYTNLPERLELGLPPERLHVAPLRTPDAPFSGEVIWVEHLGSRSILGIKLGQTTVKAVVPHDHPVRGEGPAWLGFNPDPRHLVDQESGRFLR
jgi:multiple sugar transport system ATP-binding protein